MILSHYYNYLTTNFETAEYEIINFIELSYQLELDQYKLLKTNIS